MERSGSTMQELYETVLGVAPLSGSMQLQRWKVENQMVAGKNSLRDGERSAAGGSSIQRSATTRGRYTCSVSLARVSCAVY
jgi:hypothetical protein